MPVRSRMPIASVVVCLAATVACQDLGAPGAVAPAFSFSNGPRTPGASPVIRVEGRNAFFIVDDARGIMSFHGQNVTLAEFCAGERDFDTMNRQFIEVPSGSVVGLFTSADHHVWIYPAAPFDCAILPGLSLIASGEARLVRSDNDLLGFGGPGANSFGWTSTGTLSDAVTGAPRHYTETVRALIQPFVPPGPDVTTILVAIRLN